MISGKLDMTFCYVLACSFMALPKVRIVDMALSMVRKVDIALPHVKIIVTAFP